LIENGSSTTTANEEALTTVENVYTSTTSPKKFPTTVESAYTSTTTTKKVPRTTTNVQTKMPSTKFTPNSNKPVNIQSLEITLDPEKEEEREYQKKTAFEKFDERFGDLDMEKSYGKLFELLWYNQLPCFDVPGITSKEKDEIFLKRCYWKNEKMNCNEIFQKRPTDRGMCCSFNIQKAEDILKESKYTESLSSLQSKELGNDEKSSQTKKPFKEPRPEAGINKGLTVIVDRHSDILSPGTVTDSFRGFITIIDDKDKYPMATLSSLIARPGYDSNIEVTAIQLEADPEIKKYDPAKRKCYFSDEFHLEMHQQYSQANCRMECKLMFASQCIKTCMEFDQECYCHNVSISKNEDINKADPCIPWFYPSEDGRSGKMCNPWVAQKFGNILDKQIPEDACNYCLPDCTLTKYSTSMSYAKFPICDHTTLGSSMLCDLMNESLNPAPWTSNAQDEFTKANESIPWYLETNAEKVVKSVKDAKQFSDRRFKVVEPFVKENLLLSSQLENPTYKAYEEDIGIVNIFFSEDRITKYLMKNRLSSFQFLSQVGGTMGLAMGISIISVIEIFYWCTYRLCRNLQN
jgi:hypothetical protein